MLVASVHGSLTLGVALFSWARSDPKRRGHRASIALIRSVALIGVLGTAVVAANTRSVFAPLIPGLGELNATLWTAGFAGIAGAFVVQYSRTHGITESSLIERALRAIPKGLREVATQASAESGADVNLVLAIMTVENLQRPPWFRRLERLKSRFFRSGTYGIMQVASKEPLSDEESIRIAVEDRLSKVHVKNKSGGIDAEALKRFAAQYNGGPSYFSSLWQAYFAAQQVNAPSAQTGTSSAQGATSPVIATLKRRVVGGQCMFCGVKIEGSAPAVATGDSGSVWVASLDRLKAMDVAVSHPHCFAVHSGIEALARLKRTADGETDG